MICFQIFPLRANLAVQLLLFPHDFLLLDSNILLPENISYYIIAAVQCTAYYIFAALQRTEEYFNFVENQSIVVISYDKVWCQYLKIDNNLGVGEGEGVN